jgi:6-methylsalicylate decarboxylase
MATAAAPHRIDTHHHIFPVGYMAAERERILAVSHRLAPQLLAWTPARAVEAMDQAGIATAITSISAPGVWFGDRDAARALTRVCNEYAAQMARDFKGRFGVFAALPLPDVDGSLAEIDYAFGALGADGIGLVTNFGDLWPGDPSMAPVFDELNRRKAVVYFHPTAPNACTNLMPGIPAPFVEFAFDTTRAILSLLFGGTLTRCPDIRFIFSHGGGTLPMLAGRIAAVARGLPNVQALYPAGVAPEFRKLYYDVVSVFDPIGFNALRQLAGISRLLFGSDFPYWSTEVNVAALAAQELSPGDLRAIERDNAVGLFPRFGA